MCATSAAQPVRSIRRRGRCDKDRRGRALARIFDRRVVSARGNGRLYYSWSEESLEAGKRRLAGDTERQALWGEVKDLRPDLKELVRTHARQPPAKKTWSGMGATKNEVRRILKAGDSVSLSSRIPGATGNSSA